MQNKKGQKIESEKIYHSLTEKKKERIAMAIKAFLKKNKKIKIAFIYGSFISREYFEDIDIAVIGNLTVDETISTELELSKKVGFDVDIKTFRTFDEIPNSFKFAILKDGKSLFGTEEIKDFPIFKYEFIKSYLDFLEFRERRWIC